MPKVLSYEALVRGGLVAQTKLVVPVTASDPGTPQDGWVWVNTTDHVLRYHENGVTRTLGTTDGAIDAEQVRDIIGATLVAGNNIDVTVDDAANTITIDVENLTSGDISDFTSAARATISVTDSGTLDLTYTGGVISGEVLDSPLLGGNSAAFFQNTDNHVDGTTNRVFTAADDSKLGGIAPGATANDTDANLRDRTTHTGTQPSTTISDFTSAARATITVADTASLDLSKSAGGEITGAVLDSPTVGGASASQLRDRSTHTGTQLADTISDFAAAVDALPLDADTLGGQSSEQLQTAITAAIVDSAPGTLDTLNELAAALGDDPNFATTITNALNARSRNFTASLTGGALTEVVTHNLGTRDLVAQVYVASGSYDQEDYIVQHTTLNTITIVSEGVNIPAGRRVVIHAVGN